MSSKTTTLVVLSFILFFIYMYPGMGAALYGAVPQTERMALIALYNNTDGDNWHDNQGWKTPPLHSDGFALPGTENTWAGVTCDHSDIMVTAIDLDSNGLSGTIPAELGNLRNLQILNLSGNQLTGSIPMELSYFSNLYKLNLSANLLTGSIPPLLAALRRLRILNLNSNQLTGSIPAALGYLSQLNELDLSSNQLTSSIPGEFAALINLRSLDLSANLLIGSIPPELSYLLGLYKLNLSANQLTGTIPPELSYLSGLTYLTLSANQLEGSIPPELADLTMLQSLDIEFNQLTGTIPPDLGSLSRLDYLGLSYNQLIGSIPPQLGNLEDLDYLDLSANQLVGGIPGELARLSELDYLVLSSNRLAGSIPLQLKNLSHLSDNKSDFRWNALYTGDETLRAFLNSKQLGGQWESTQTITPKGVSARAVSGTSIEVSWLPISYTWDDGGYRLLYSQTPGGPYVLFGATETKYDSRLEFSGAEPFTPYYFVVQTRTESHQYNRNTLESEWSEEVSAFTTGSDKIISGRVAEDSGTGVAGITMIFSPSTRTGITDASGYYRYAVKTGWSGTVKPARTGYNFEPIERKLENVTSHQRSIDFKAAPITRKISGDVLSGGEGIAGVTLTFASYSGETNTAITDVEGHYEYLVPFEWTGWVTPSKGDLIFYPLYKDYVEPVKKHMGKQSYQLSVSITLNVSRKQDDTVIISKGYGEIELNVDIIGILPDIVKAFVIFRKEKDAADSTYEPITEFAVQEPYHFTYVDKYLDKNKNYTYIGRALDAVGNVIGESKEKII